MFHDFENLYLILVPRYKNEITIPSVKKNTNQNYKRMCNGYHKQIFLSETFYVID